MAFSFSPLLNGERAVVALFIAAVLSSLPTSLFSHGISLSLLSLFALFVEIRAESLLSLPQFKTRQGVSSGILLGAVTLPAVMLSKLIQLSRAYSSSEIELHELNYLAMQYWAALSACFSVLIFLCLTMDNTPSSKRNAWPAKFSLISGVTCAALFLSSNAGSDVALKLPWVLLHGLAAVKLVQHLLHTFPSCTSIGEALLMTGGLVLYFADMLACTVAKLYQNLNSSELVSSQYQINTSEIGIIIQGLLFGLLLFPNFFKFVLRVSDCLLGIRNSTARAYTERGRSFIFFASLAFVMIVVVPLWMQFVQSFHVHPFLWAYTERGRSFIFFASLAFVMIVVVLLWMQFVQSFHVHPFLRVMTFVFSEPVKRLSFCFYWVCLINVFILWVYNISKNSKLERILLRKYYHLMAVLMFLPAGICEPKFLGLAFGAALVVFLALEIIRVWRIWPLGQLIHQFMNAFTDHRDSDLLIISHFSLLLGCALPMWMSSGYSDRPLAPFAGILSLGIGDTMASVVGHKYGVLRWSKTGKKTIEGTAAGITGVLAASLILLTSIGYIFTQHWVSIIVAVIVSGLLEAYTAQLDNAFIPLVFYSLLCL